jgi:aerobic carbon-monoxide dehydrogenase medium subunit
MKPAPFAYAAPDSLPAALSLLAGHGDDAKLLAGGQSLIPAMNFRLVQPGVLIDLNGVTELAYVRTAENEDLRLGAMTRQSDLERHPAVAERAPLLAEALPYIAHPQIRNRGTVGGSLVHADPAAELPVIMVALDARFRLVSEAGERWVSAIDFFQGMFTVDLAADELLVEIAVSPLPPRTGSTFLELARRRGDYAMIGVAVWLTLTEDGRCQQARLVYLNAGDAPVVAPVAAQLMAGEHPSPALFEAVAAAVDKEIEPQGNVHAPAAYQRHLAAVLTRRALLLAFRRAGGEVQVDGC